MNRVCRWLLALSLFFTCAGLTGLSPASAQNGLRQDYRGDRRNMRQMKLNLDHLLFLRRQAMRHHQMGRVRSLDMQIATLRSQIQQVQQDYHGDVHPGRRHPGRNHGDNDHDNH